jgi:hypothetical protein
MPLIRGGEAQEANYRVFRALKVRLGLGIGKLQLTILSIESEPRLYVDNQGTVNMTSTMVPTKP